MSKLLNKVVLTMAMCLAILAMTSCDNEDIDGDQDPFKWKKVDYPTTKKGNTTYYSIPAEGGTYTFHCTNYSFWINNIITNEGDSTSTYYAIEDSLHSTGTDGLINYKTDMYSLQSTRENKGRSITITFNENNSAYARYFYFDFEAGDAFDDINFIQWTDMLYSSNKENKGG